VRYREELKQKGYDFSVKLGFGNPKQVIPKIITHSDCDLLVMGAHGHNFFKDLLLGTTVESVRHSLTIPVLIVRKK
jgi:manganese transport protein